MKIAEEKHQSHQITQQRKPEGSNLKSRKQAKDLKTHNMQNHNNPALPAACCFKAIKYIGASCKY